MSHTLKFVLAALFLVLPVRAGAGPQFHESPGQLAADEAQADRAARAQWDAHCQAAFAAAYQHHGLPLLSGPPGGYYNLVGSSISDVIAQKSSQQHGADLEIESIPTEETGCNLLGLEVGVADFALVQSDVAHDAWFGHPPVRSAPAQNISLVAPLFVEAVHVLIRPHLNLAHLSDLRGRRVWLGAEHSLTALTSRRILEAAGVTSADIAAMQTYTDERSGQKRSVTQISSKEALDALKRLDLDAMFQVGAVPSDSLHDALVPHDTSGQLLVAQRKGKACDAVRKARTNDLSLLDTEIHLFNLDVDLVERLVADGSYVEQLIPPDAYCQDKATLTVGVRALLLTRLHIHDSDDGRVRILAGAIQRYQRDIEARLREQIVLMQQAHEDAVTGDPSRLSLLRVPTPLPLTVHYHPSITADNLYFNPASRTHRDVSIFAIVLLILFLLLYRYRRYTGPWLARRGGLAAGFAAPVILWVVTAVLLKRHEGAVNENFNTFSASLVSAFEDLVSYYFGVFGSIGSAPVTQSGQAALSWCGKGFIYLCGLVLTPTIIFYAPKLWAAAKVWLLALGNTRAVSPPHATETPGASDHDIPPHPAPSR